MAVWSVVKSSFVINSSRIDGEYFKPKYLDILNKLNRYEPLSKYVTEFIHPGEFKRIYSKQGVSVLRAQNVRPLKIDINENDELFLQEEIANKLTKNFLQFGDILITRTGANYGQTALFTNEREQAIVTSHTFIVRVRDINSAYLALFLNTDLGIKQIEQGMYGSSQPEIAPKFLKRILVPRFEYDIEEQISKDVLKAYELRQQSQTLYKEAEELLEKELGLDDLEFEKPRSYTAKLSEVVSNSKFSSYFFQPKYKQILDLIENKSVPLKSLISNYSSGFAFSKNVFSNIETNHRLIKIQNLAPSIVELNNCEYINKKGAELGQNEVAELGDILIGLSGTVGISSIVREDSVGAFINQRIFRIKPKDINTEYLMIVLNSLIGKMQIERYGTGGVQTNVSPNDILKVQVPRIGLEKEEYIGKLVLESYILKKQSKQLLEDAKAKVEALIEEATR